MFSVVSDLPSSFKGPSFLELYSNCDFLFEGIVYFTAFLFNFGVFKDIF